MASSRLRIGTVSIDFYPTAQNSNDLSRNQQLKYRFDTASEERRSLPVSRFVLVRIAVYLTGMTVIDDGR
jgi:hypothetical protein